MIFVGSKFSTDDDTDLLSFSEEPTRLNGGKKFLPLILGGLIPPSKSFRPFFAILLFDLGDLEPARLDMVLCRLGDLGCRARARRSSICFLILFMLRLLPAYFVLVPFFLFVSFVLEPHFHFVLVQYFLLSCNPGLFLCFPLSFLFFPRFLFLH